MGIIKSNGIFSPFIISIDGMLGREAQVVIMIIDFGLGDEDCETHKKEPMKPLLDQWEK